MTQRCLSAFFSVLILSTTVLLTGCGGNPGTEQVDVTITYNGQPVQDVIVTFNPEDGRPAVGRTDEQGKVVGVTTFSPNDGVLPGQHTITLAPATDASETIDSADAYAQVTDVGFPQKYMTTQMSDLKMTVAPGEPNEKTFELTD